MGRKSLDNILNEDSDTTAEIRQANPDEAVEQKGVEPAEEPEPEQTPEPEPKPSEPPSDKLPEDVYKPLKAVRDENKELKQRLDQLEQLRREADANKEPEKPKPTIWEDDQAWQQDFGGQVVSQAVQVASYENKLSTSEFYARKNLEGFEEKWDDLNSWLKENPAVAEKASADYDPWGFAFRQYKNQQDLADIGDVESYKQRVREELMAELQQSQQPTVPPSLSTQRSVGSRGGPAWNGPKPLGDLLK
jgi:hypothetical protein